MTAMVLDTLGGFDIIMGSPTLKEYNCTLDFGSSTLRFKRRTILVRPSQNFCLKPGEKRIMQLQGKTPEFLKNAEVIIRSNKHLQKIMPERVLVKLKRGRAAVQVYNPTKRPINIRADKAGGCMELSQFGQIGVHVSPVDTMHTLTETERDSLEKSTKRKYPYLEKDDPRLRLTEQEILEKAINLDTCTLSVEGKAKLRELLASKKQAFSLFDEPGNAENAEKIDFDLMDDTPFFVRPYHLSNSERLVVQKELLRLENLGIIKKGRTAYTSPLMVLKNKSGKLRAVSDMRFLNNRIRKEHYPFPLVKNVISEIGRAEAKYLSCLDLRAAYHSLNLTEKSQDYCGITGYFGGDAYKYTKVPMGLTLAPAVWQNFMKSILEEIPNYQEFACAIMDDIAIWSRSEAEHLKHVEQILDLLIKHGLKVSPQKAQLSPEKLKYMGHTLAIVDGIPTITAEKTKTEAIMKLEPPRTTRQVRRFIGMCQFLASYIDRLQELLIPFHDLTKKNVKFDFTPKHQENFEKIKTLIQNPPVLAMPTGHGRLYLYSDTSRKATGSSLWQMINGRQRLIGYHSKTLSTSAGNYSCSELEMCGLLMNIQAFRYLLKGTTFSAFVDHSSLVQIIKSKSEPPTNRMKRYLEKLSDYSFELGYTKGSTLCIADFLSRSPDPNDSPDDPVRPISFAELTTEHASEACNVVAMADGEHCGVTVGTESVRERPVTRAYARENRIPIPPLFAGESTEKRIQSPMRPIINETRAPEREQDTQVRPSIQPATAVQRRNRNSNTLVEECADARRPLQPPRTLQEMAQASERGNGVIEPEVTETFEEPTTDQFPNIEPLFNRLRTDQIITKHLPRQHEVDQILELIKKKALRDYHLPINIQNLKRLQSSDGFFGEVYAYLATGMLPKDKRSAKQVLLQAESYILIDGVLFRLMLNKQRNDLKLTLAVPETLVPTILEIYHDSILSSHNGVTRTCLTLRRLFYIPGMYGKVAAFLRSCQICQERKGAHDVKIPLRPRLPVDTNIFSVVSIDIKSMPPSSDGHQHILVMVCEVSRYVIGVPLKSIDAVTIAEAILQRLILHHGIPRQIHCDAAKSFTGKLMDLIYQVLGVKVAVISPYNHNSLLVERHLATLANHLVANLRGRGRQWPLFVQAAVWSHNAFASPTLGGYSPHYLVFLRHPSDFSGLVFPEISDLASSYAHYVEILKARFSHVTKTLADLQTIRQNKQAIESARVAKGPQWREGQLVYLLAPSASALQMPSRKVILSYTGPYLLREKLDETHAILQCLDGRIISNVFHVKRLKPAFIRTEKGPIADVTQLRQALKDQKSPITDKLGAKLQQTQRIHVYNEEGTTLYAQDQSSSHNEALEIELGTFARYADENCNLAFDKQLTPKQIAKAIKHMTSMPSDGSLFSVTKARFKSGHLELLLTSDEMPKYTVWVRPYDHPEVGAKLAEMALVNDSRCRVTGSPQRLLRELYYGT